MGRTGEAGGVGALRGGSDRKGVCPVTGLSGDEDRGDGEVSSRNARRFPMGGTAVVRISLDSLGRAIREGADPEQVSWGVHVVRVYWSSDEARAEAERLNDVNAGKGLYYFTSLVHAEVPSEEALSYARAKAARVKGGLPDVDALK